MSKLSTNQAVTEAIDSTSLGYWCLTDLAALFEAIKKTRRAEFHDFQTGEYWRLPS